MILFILNDYLKPPKAQPNLSIRHSGPHNGTQSKRPSLKMVNRLGEKQRPGIERNFPEVPEVETRRGAQDLRNRGQFWSGDRSRYTRITQHFHLEESQQFPVSWKMQWQSRGPKQSWRHCLGSHEAHVKSWCRFQLLDAGGFELGFNLSSEWNTVSLGLVISVCGC